jgi:hypothetical protein
MPAAHYAHPEFGLLCPTPRLRRTVRIAFACMVLAAIGVAVLRASNSPPSILTAASREESAGTSPDAGQALAATFAARPSLTEGAETGAVKTACEQDNSAHRTWAYLDGKCVAGKARKPRMVRVATDRPAIAAIAIGRTSAAPERALEPVSPAAGAPAGPQADPPKSAPAAPIDAAASAEPPPRPAAASKKPQKTARSQNRRRDPGGTDGLWGREVRADDWSARGYGERDYGRSGYAREGSFGLGYGERDYGRGGYAREGSFGVFR